MHRTLFDVLFIASHMYAAFTQRKCTLIKQTGLLRSALLVIVSSKLIWQMHKIHLMKIIMIKFANAVE